MGVDDLKVFVYDHSPPLVALFGPTAEKDELVGWQCLGAYRFDGLGHKTITRLIWVGRGPNKIEDLKDSDGHVVDIARLCRS